MIGFAIGGPARVLVFSQANQTGRQLPNLLQPIHTKPRYVLSRSSSGVGFALITVVLWASSFPFITIALRSFDPVPLASLRFAIVAGLMSCWLLWRKPKLPQRRDGFRLMVCAVIGVAGYHTFLNIGQQTVSAGATSFIVNTVPIMTALLAVTFLGERFGSWAWIGSAVSLSGICLIASGQKGGLNLGGGASLVLAAAACQAVLFTLQRPLIVAHGAMVCVASISIIGMLCLAPWLPLALEQAARAPANALWAVAYLGVFSSAVGNATWGMTQATFGASRAANFLFLVPPVASAVAVFVTLEVPTLPTLLGGTIAIAGVLVVNSRAR